MGNKTTIEQTISTEINTDEKQFLSFFLGFDEFGINIMNVREILSYSELTHVPMLPQFVRGVLNLRGHVVPVIDLGFRFHRSETSITKSTCIIITEIATEQSIIDVGVLVDSVSEVISFSQNEVEPPPKLGTGSKIKTTFIEGMGKLEKGFLILLDIQRVLDFDDLVMLEEAQEIGKQLLLEKSNKEEAETGESTESEDAFFKG